MVIYEPNQRLKTSWLKSWLTLALNIIYSRELIWQLFRRDFLMSYKNSFLGVSWMIITPIMGIISWVIMNLAGILTPGNVGIPYPAFVLLSSSIYGLFMSFYSGASGTLSAGSGFILQVKFSHDALLAKQILIQLANFIITFMINLIVLFIFGVVPSWMIFLFPIFIIPMIFLGSAIGLISAVIGVVASDINKGIGVIMGLLMYVTPVIYSSDVKCHTLQAIIKWNPLTYLIGTVRDSIIYGRIDHFECYLISSVMAIVLFLIAWRIFYVTEEKVIEKMI